MKNLFWYDYYQYAGNIRRGGVFINLLKRHELRYLFFQRKANISGKVVSKLFRSLSLLIGRKYGLEIYTKNIGKFFYIGHPYGITINPNAIIGNCVSVHKGCTIGQENRGVRKGVPILGNCVWVGVNATIVGQIMIGDDVLIAPNTYVNRDIPSHSIVFGNPCVVKSSANATKDYFRFVNYDNYADYINT